MINRIPDCYDDFVEVLFEAGFSMSGGNTEDVFSAIPVSWGDSPSPATRIRWFTGDPDTDPWEWRMRLLNERDDVAYAKMFFRKGGYITKKWYPYFLAARRDGMEFDEEYESGAISNFAKRIYAVVAGRGAVPLDGIKRLGGFTRQDKSRFESALVELQMKLYITICGYIQRVTKQGREYGWMTTVFSTTENFWGKSHTPAQTRPEPTFAPPDAFYANANTLDETPGAFAADAKIAAAPDVFAVAAKFSADDAYDALAEQIYALNPNADETKVHKFIMGK